MFYSCSIILAAAVSLLTYAAGTLHDELHILLTYAAGTYIDYYIYYLHVLLTYAAGTPYTYIYATYIMRPPVSTPTPSTAERKTRSIHDMGVYIYIYIYMCIYIYIYIYIHMYIMYRCMHMNVRQC